MVRSLRAHSHHVSCVAPPPSDTSPNFRDILAVVFLSHRAELTVRLVICREVGPNLHILELLLALTVTRHPA